MDIAEIVKSQPTFIKLHAGEFPHAVLFSSCDERLNEVTLIMSALSLSYPMFELFNEGSAEFLKVQNGADVDIKVYPKGDRLLVADSNEIVSEVYIKPALHERKIFLIKNIDSSTEQAQNKLLKVLEEPPKNVYFLLSCADENLVLPTIKSRCQRVVLPKIPKEEFQKLAKKPLASMLADGYIGIYEKYEKKENLAEIADFAVGLVTNLKNSSEVLSFSVKLMAFKETDLIFEIYAKALEDILKLKAEREDILSLPIYKDALKSVENEFSIGAICEINSLLADFKRRKESNASEQVSVEELLLKILEVKYLCK